MTCTWLYFLCTFRYRLMLKCWEADVDGRICFKEIVMELTREVSDSYATESSTDKDYVTVMPCTELARELSEDHATKDYATKDYMTVMACHKIES